MQDIPPYTSDLVDPARHSGGRDGGQRETARSLSLTHSAAWCVFKLGLRDHCDRVRASRALSDYLAHVGLSVPLEAIARASRRSAESVCRDIGRVEGLREARSVDAVLTLLEAGLVALRGSLGSAP